MLEDSKGRFWVNTDDGLSLFDPKTQTFKNYYPDTSVMPIQGISYTEMMEDQFGRIWIGGYYDIVIFDPKTEKFQKSGWFDYAKNTEIIKVEERNSISQSIKRKSETELWLMTVYGLFSVHTPTNTYTYYPNPNLDDYFAFAIHYIDSSGKLWIGTYDQCYYTFDPKMGKWSHFTCPERIKVSSDAVLNINEYDTNTLLFTRLDNLYLYDIQSGVFTLFDWKENLDTRLSNGIFQTLVSGDDVFIIKVGNQPFVHLSKKRTLINKTKIPLPKNYVNNHSYVTSNGLILSGDWDKNEILACDSIFCTALVDEKNNTKLGNLQLHFQSKNGEHFFSTSLQLYKWNITENKVQKISQKNILIDEQKTEFRNFTEDNRGNIYIRERSKGIFMLKNGKEDLEYFDCGIQGENFNALYYDKASDRLWLSSEKHGLFVIDPLTRSFKNYSIGNLAQTNKGIIFDISGDDRGNIFLLIANRGLIRINSRDMIPKIYTSSDGLISDAVRYGLIIKNIFWFTTESGLMAFDYQNERFYSFDNEPDSKLFTYRIFSDNKGNIMQNLYPEQIISFDQSALIQYQTKANIYLKEVKLSGKIMPNDSLFKVGYHQNNFVFLFGNTGSNGLNNKEFQYSINDESWQALENSTISLYNLSPGTYRIKVANKFDTKYFFTLTVIVIPPWWKTTWFYVTMLLLTLITGFAAYKKRIASIKKEESEKNSLKQRITEIEMTALRAQMNPHFIFNCLNSINRFILVHDTEAASEYLTKFSRLIRMILDGSREDYIALDKELDALTLYIEMESMRFQDSFEWLIDIDSNVQKENIMIPPLLLQPYVENAIWHGLMQAPSGLAKKLKIQIHQNETGVVIEIQDNGIGRLKAQEIKSKDGNAHKSHGIALTNERLKLMEKLKGVKTKISIEDIDDPDQKASGTKVTIFINI
jgi:streptogramin lyase